jgi:hypothetical protein
MTRDQKIVAIGSGSGVVAMIAAMIGLAKIWPISRSFDGVADRIAYTLQLDAVAALPLLLAIVAVANGF